MVEEPDDVGDVDPARALIPNDPVTCLTSAGTPARVRRARIAVGVAASLWLRRY